jgi:hypothetical protein
MLFLFKVSAWLFNHAVCKIGLNKYFSDAISINTACSCIFKDLSIELSCGNYRYKVEGGTLNDMTNFYTYKPSSANHHLDQAKRHKAEGVKVAVS